MLVCCPVGVLYGSPHEPHLLFHIFDCCWIGPSQIENNVNEVNKAKSSLRFVH